MNIKTLEDYSKLTIIDRFHIWSCTRAINRCFNDLVRSKSYLYMCKGEVKRITDVMLIDDVSRLWGTYLLAVYREFIIALSMDMFKMKLSTKYRIIYWESDSRQYYKWRVDIGV